MQTDGYLQAKKHATLLEIQRYLNNYLTQIVSRHRVMLLLNGGQQAVYILFFLLEAVTVNTQVKSLPASL